MNINLKILTIFILTFLFTGCSNKKPTYYWGDYSYTSFAYGLKSSDQGIMQKHLSELDQIIKQANKNQSKVPPGIYAEYGKILFEANKRDEAKNFFILEKKTYPESEIFINQVLVKLYGGVK